MTKFTRPLLLLSCLYAAVMTGCAQYPCCARPQFVNAASDGVGTFSVFNPTCERACERVTVAPTRIQVVGYGSQGSFTQYTQGQQKLAAMRAAEVDAYRKLAEQVQGFRLSSGTTVSAFAVQHDSIRTYVDSYIRGARVASVTSIGDGNFQAHVELELTPQFVGCVANYSNCGFAYQNSGCFASGCIYPSSAYYRY
ncbi:MAG: LPP20 family lipoprotein [Actinomycetes bacterium]